MVHKFICEGDIKEEVAYIVNIYEKKNSWFELRFNNEEEWIKYEPAYIIYYFTENDGIVECVKLEETYYKFSEKDDSVILYTVEEYIKLFVDEEYMKQK